MNLYKIYLFILLVGSMQAQKSLTLEQCIDLGLQNSPLITQAMLQIESAKTGISRAKSQFIPFVEAGISQRINFGRSIDQFTNSYIDQVYNTTFGYIQINEPIFQGFSVINDIKANKYTTDAEKNALQAAKNNLIVTIIDQYFTVLANQELMLLAQEQLKSAELQQDQQVALFNAGRTNAIQKLLVENLVKQEFISTIQAESALKLSKLALGQTINITIDEQTSCSIDVSIDRILLEDMQVDFSKVALPEQLSFLDRISSLAYQIKSIKGRTYPQININANYSTFYASSNSTRTFSEQLNDTRNGSVGLGLSIPIGASFTLKPQIDLLKIQQEQILNNKRQTDITIQNAINTRKLHFDIAKKTYIANEDQLALSAKIVDLTTQSLEAGTSTVNDLILSRNQEMINNSRKIQLKYSMILHYKLLEYYKSNGFVL